MWPLESLWQYFEHMVQVLIQLMNWSQRNGWDPQAGLFVQVAPSSEIQFECESSVQVEQEWKRAINMSNRIPGGRGPVAF